MPLSLPPLTTRPPVDLVSTPAPTRSRPTADREPRSDDFRTALDDAVAGSRRDSPDAREAPRDAQPSRDDPPRDDRAADSAHAAESANAAEPAPADAADDAPVGSSDDRPASDAPAETAEPERIEIDGLVVAPDALRIAPRPIQTETGGADVTTPRSGFETGPRTTNTAVAASAAAETSSTPVTTIPSDAVNDAAVERPFLTSPSSSSSAVIAPSTQAEARGGATAPAASGVASTTSGAVQVAATVTPPPAVARPNQNPTQRQSTAPAAAVTPVVPTPDAPTIEADVAPKIAVEPEPAPPPAPAVARAASLNQSLGGPESAAPSGLSPDGGAALTSADMSGRPTFTSLGDAQTAAQELRQSLLSAESTPDDAVTKRVVRGMSTMISRHGGSMTMRLDPPELGQLKVQMSIVRGVVTASFIASTDSARQLLERNLGMLRTSLENQGLTVERLAVQTAAATSSNGAATTGRDDPGQQQQQSADGRRDAANGESRGRRDESEQRRDRPRSFTEQFDDAAFRDAMNDDEHAPSHG